MHVRKFEADTLEEALRLVKEEFGPDAIILKTVNNKGLKGALKKKKIEITAAISERSYVKKASVDKVLTPDQKKSFYSGGASSISESINDFSSSSSESSRFAVSQKGPAVASPSKVSYGGLGLNKSVKTVKPEDESGGGLDAFLAKKNVAEKSPSSDALSSFLSSKPQTPARDEFEYERATPAPVPLSQPAPSKESGVNNKKIEILEKQIFELSKRLGEIERPEPRGVYQLSTVLRSLEISSSLVNALVQKSTFDLSRDELESEEVVFEYALSQMAKEIRTENALFSKIDSGAPVITILMSGGSSGQTSMLLKLGALKENSVLISLVDTTKRTLDAMTFAEKIFGLEVKRVSSMPEIVTECRKATEAGKSIFVDYKVKLTDVTETKKFIDGIRRSFRHVEILISLSAIHSELYNKKVVGALRPLGNGLVISHVDECLNFGALYNLVHSEKELPVKFFGNGKIVPDDLETATAERILAGMFQLGE